ncbi:MAG: hypothetical protein H0U44_06495 [Flavisolibacter sp.]|jgi:hypothetical protein|nr:hypothetical protein [Flavisolibacter sp.]
MRNIILIFMISVLPAALKAQNVKSSSSIKFNSLLQAGLLEGSAGSAFSLSTINGVRIKSFSAGVGVGLDYYTVRSVPVFIDLRKDLLKSDKTPFVYVSAGRHFPWLKNNENNEWITSKTFPGWYYDLGIGYSIPIQSQALFFSAGYSYKAFRETTEMSTICLRGECPTFKEEFSYALRRISIKAGFRF